MQVHHIGYLVKMPRAISVLKELDYQPETDVIYDEFREIDVCFLTKNGYRIELILPKSKNSIVYDLQKKIGNSPYHICYSCNNIEGEIKKHRDIGFVKYNEPQEAVAFSNRKICFKIHPYLGMIELLED